MRGLIVVGCAHPTGYWLSVRNNSEASLVVKRFAAIVKTQKPSQV
jgi:hypothetical protein